MKLIQTLAVATLLVAPTGCGSDATAPKSSPSVKSPTSTATADDGFAPLAAGATRVKLTLDTFDLAPGGETYKCQNFANPFGADVAILQTQSTMSVGSHHLAAFRIAESADGSLEDCSGLEFHPTIHAAQTPTAKTTFPDGVGAFMAGTEGIRLNAHYFNLTDDTVHAEVTVVFDYVAPEKVQFTAAQIYLNDSTLDIPPGQGSAGGTLALPAGTGAIKLISTQSHMHRRAVAFEAKLDDGTMLYQTTTWNEPPVKTYAPPMDIAEGANVTWKCDYDNETTGDLVFGESAVTNEMCVLTGFYYPAPDGQMIVGDLLGGSKAASLLK
ncbi:MAG TPA: hypothetical protein VH062_27365 [Polyangiaceae bacterium]|jgi:hypothetical protein|nr:hypothetical protein [Polyangiaceae bacterium]